MPAHPAADGGDVAADHPGVGDDDLRRRPARRAWAARTSARCAEPDSSSPSTSSFSDTAGAVGPGGGEVGADPEQHHRDVALVVGGAAPAQLLPHHLGLERRERPAVGDVRGLHVVVAVDEDRGAGSSPGAGSAAGQCAHTAGSASVSSHDLDLRPAVAAQRVGQPLPRTARRRRGGRAGRSPRGCAASPTARRRRRRHGSGPRRVRGTWPHGSARSDQRSDLGAPDPRDEPDEEPEDDRCEPVRRVFRDEPVGVDQQRRRSSLGLKAA